MFRVKASLAKHGNFKMPCFLVGNDAGNRAFFFLLSTMTRYRIPLLMLAAVAALTVCLIGCGGQQGSNRTHGNRTLATVTDDLGREVTVPVRIERIVSLAPSVTENVFAVGAGDRLVGVTTFCNYPEQAKSIAKVGDTTSPNMETIVALKPDVVMVSSASQLEAFTKVLESNGIAVYVTAPDSLDAVFKSLVQLGEMFGTRDKAEELVRGLRQRVDAVGQALFRQVRASNGIEGHRPMPVFVQISKEPLFTIGKGSFLTMMLQRADAASVTADVTSGYPRLSKESAAALDPEAIILSDSDDNTEPNEVFKNSPAVRNGRVYRINADILSRPGPRLVDALEQIARDLHPEAFRN